MGAEKKNKPKALLTFSPWVLAPPRGHAWNVRGPFLVASIGVTPNMSGQGVSGVGHPAIHKTDKGITVWRQTPYLPLDCPSSHPCRWKACLQFYQPGTYLGFIIKHKVFCTQIYLLSPTAFSGIPELCTQKDGYILFALGLHQEVLTLLGNDTFEKFESIQPIFVIATCLISSGRNADGCQNMYMLKYVLSY